MRVTLFDVLKHWGAAELDLHEVWGVDVEDDALMTARSWRWLELRLSDLVLHGPRLAPALKSSARSS